MANASMTERVQNSWKEAVGMAQKRLTLLEQEARKMLTTTYTKIAESPSLKTAGTKVSQLRTRAVKTFGLATKADLKTITTKINRLGTQLRDMMRRGHKTEPATEQK